MNEKIEGLVHDIITDVLEHSGSYRFAKEYREAQEKYWIKRFVEQQPPAGEFRQKVTCALLDCRSDKEQLRIALNLLHQAEDIIDQAEAEIKALKQ